MNTPHRLIISLLTLGVAACSEASDSASKHNYDRKTHELESKPQQLKAKMDTTLSRDRALAMLAAIKKDTITRDVGLVRLHPSWRPTNQDVRFVFEAADEGFFTRKGGQLDSIRFAITAKTKPFVVAEGRGGTVTLRMADLEPIEVTGIGAPSNMNGRTVSSVMFKYRFKPTPLGDAFDRINNVHMFTGWVPGQAYFALHDDGWRIESWNRVHQ